MNFEEAESRYRQLQDQMHTGQLTQAQFEAQVNALRVAAPDGATWQMRAADGAWMRWNGSHWEEGSAQPGIAAAPQAKGRKKLSCMMTAGIAAAVFVCGLLLAVGVGYYMITTGSLSYIQLANLVGPGSGEIMIVNLDDVRLEAALTRLDAAGGSPESIGSQVLEPFDIGGYGRVESGRYRLVIEATSGGECHLEIVRGDEYQFVAVPEGVAVTRAADPSQTADQLDMSSSTLCRP